MPARRSEASFASRLTFMERLMRGLREAIAAGEYAREAQRLLE
jgi:hypothetical protein